MIVFGWLQHVPLIFIQANRWLEAGREECLDPMAWTIGGALIRPGSLPVHLYAAHVIHQSSSLSRWLLTWGSNYCSPVFHADIRNFLFVCPSLSHFLVVTSFDATYDSFALWADSRNDLRFKLKMSLFCDPSSELNLLSRSFLLKCAVDKH